MEPQEQQLSRSEFIAGLGRKGMLAGLVGLGAAALHGNKSVAECMNNNYCASCWAFSGCSLPEKQEIEQ